MPRFNPKRWHPSRDSSLRHFQRSVKDKKVHLDIQPDGGCPCGCFGRPKGGTARFAMGHDARLRGVLIRCHLTGTPVVEHIGGDGVGAELTAKEMAGRYGESFVRALEEAELRREGKNREVLRKALNSKRLIRVGRWEYTGQVVAVYGTNGDEEYQVEYVTKLGEKRTKRISAAETKEVST